MSFGPWELLIILAIVLVIFGPRRLKTLGSDLGNAIKGFRSAMTEKEESQGADDPKVIDGKVDETSDPAKQKSQQDNNV